MRRTLTISSIVIMTAIAAKLFSTSHGPVSPQTPILSLSSPLTDNSSTLTAPTPSVALNRTSLTAPLRLTSLDGRLYYLPHRTRGPASVYVFLGLQCPISNWYIPELNRLAAKFQPLGIAFFGIVSDAHTPRHEVVDHQREYPLSFPVLYDPTGSGRQRLQATHTPQVVVTNGVGQISYSGRIDNRFAELGRQRQQTTQHDLRDTLAALASGKRSRRRSTEPIGCLLEPLRSPSNQQHVTFRRDIAPIIYANCTECHRPGESAPFPLQSYTDVVRRAQQIREVVHRGLMPPWKPEMDFGHFQNERRLAPRDYELLLRWIDSGGPEGTDRPVTPLPVFTTGWQLGEPDLILELEDAFPVPADGPDIYRHFVLPSGLLKNRLVSAMEFRPGDARVVHHALAYLDRSGTARQLDAADAGQGYSRFGGPGFAPSGNLGGWGPGGSPRRLPDGMGRVMWKDCDVVLQIHYHPIGQSTQDRSRIGLYFADPGAQTLVSEILVANVDLDIPPGASQHIHEASYTLPVDTCLLDATPHMHLLGHEIEAIAVLPGQPAVPLIRIRDWSFYWQDHYVYRQPIWLPAGTHIKVRATFDNSANNPLNPHQPAQRVRWGEHSTDEMAICYFQVTTRNMQDFRTLTDHNQRFYEGLMQRYQDSNRQHAEQGAARPVRPLSPLKQSPLKQSPLNRQSFNRPLSPDGR